jgi:NAD-dependent deacetylase
MFDEFYLITQNIDNLHRRAGSKNITELHGNAERNYCIKCKKFYNEIDLNQKSVMKCECGGLIRPDVVWFGEMLPFDALRFAEDCAMRSDVFFTIGTSAEVYPAALLPLMARKSGAYVAEINTRLTAISNEVDIVIEGKSGEILKELAETIKTIRKSKKT